MVGGPCALDEYALVYSMVSEEMTTGLTMTTTSSGAKKLSKKEQKRQARGDSGTKKEKDPNRWAVDPEKQKAKAEKAARAKASKEARSKIEEVEAPPTPCGEKKVLAALMAKTYAPSAVEASWQEWWEKSGLYGCEARTVGDNKKFVIVIPPPNVTGSLHLGHALTAAIEDCLARWHRMRGDATLYVPGTDHAGIATQSVVEKQLAKQSVSRHDLGREKFLEKVWEWKEQYGSRICRQLRRLGSSVDWGRERFTMDPMCAKAVTEAFVRLHERGLVYRASRLVNWSVALKSAISDLEVEYVELEGGEWRSVPNHAEEASYQFGMFTEFAYKVIDDESGVETGDEVVVATTRLETMLGDVAVAVHPRDPRYERLHGKRVRHPFFPSRRVDIILDDVLVDMTLGTGCVKITPAHDPNDYECGKRHDLRFITILDVDGRIVSEATPFFSSQNRPVEQSEVFPAWVAGKKRYDARKIVEDKLRELGLIRDKYPRPMRLALCSRSNDIIEPLVQPQWFVECSGMARRACEAVRNGSLRILPSMHEKTWFQWLKNIRPWCVSRQLWWGHRIPAWFAYAEGDEDVDVNSPAMSHRWVVARDDSEAAGRATEILAEEGKVLGRLARDDDVLDTWFSSGLFPFSVFGWPDTTPDLEAFYPTTLLETGLDILFFWVARMVMLGLELTDSLPFTDVYLHAMVRDKDGRKMSKSLGNVIDPLEVIDGCDLEALVSRLREGNLKPEEIARAEKGHRADFPEGIPRCGTDALRVGLLAYTVQGRDINLDIKRVIGYRNFCNKLWNVVRFVLGCFGDFRIDAVKFDDDDAAADLAPRDRFALSRLDAAVQAVSSSLETYAFADAVEALYRFFLDDLCDVYVELVKPVVYEDDKNVTAAAAARDAAITAKKTLWACLDVGLRALHPFCPFVTEELWQRLPRPQPLDTSIMVAPYPEPLGRRDPGVEADTRLVLACVDAARSLRAQYNVARKPAAFYVRFTTPDKNAAFARQLDDFETLAKASTTTLLSPRDPTPTDCALKIVDETTAVLIDLKGLVDPKAEIDKLAKQIDDLTPLISKLEAKQADPAYLANAPEKQRRLDADKLRQYTERRDVAQQAIAMWEQTAASSSSS
ncbi:hypothetical protein CTAYLR_005497 [Chrysophaeum taylorii]|uniref:valine--tRNA ligase n=1 Tax=Chrysophaeum taylorii TaxID=2483200 RepID=A0AAD7U4N0_9STRA|nr:hypothetical protein CTAYLR_005497 [Chrysophaeum taylorii]